MKLLYKLTLSFFCLLASTYIFAQTAGIGEVTSIQSKAATISSNLLKIDQYKAELPQLLQLRNSKLTKLKEELAALYKERDNIIADMKVGARCSQCGEWKSNFEKKGVNFQQHLGEVKGYAVPATTSELEAARSRYTEKIALKKVQIQNIEQADDAYAKKEKEIAALQKENEKLCAEIYTLSNTYEQKVVAEGKSLQRSWIDPAMSAAAYEHIAQDKVYILQGRIDAAQKEWIEKSNALRDRIKKENEDRKQLLQKEITAQEQKNTEAESDYNNKIEEIKTLKEPKSNRLAELNAQLKLNITDSVKQLLIAEATQLQKDLATLQQKEVSLQTAYKNATDAREVQIKKWKDEIWKLTTGLTKMQDEEVALLKKTYDTIINNLKLEKTKQEQLLPAAHTRFITAANDARNKLIAYGNVIHKENGMMYAAATKVKCTVRTQAHLSVNSNFNTEATCMEGLKNRDRSFPSTGMDCAAKSNAYMSVYRPHLAALNQQDKNSIKTNTASYWSQSIF